MLKKTSTLSLVALLAIMSSCKKDADKTVSPEKNTLPGTYTLTNVNVNQSTTMIGLMNGGSTDSAKGVYRSNYALENVQGTFNFTKDSLYITGLAFSATPTMYMDMYTWPENVLIQTAPLESYPVGQEPSDIAFVYAGVQGKDSVSFPQGGFMYPSAGMPVPLTTKGATYAFVGDTLKLTMPSDTAISFANSNAPSNGFSYFGAKSELQLKLVKKK